MTKKEKGRNRSDGATFNTDSSTRKDIRYCLKMAIGRMAVWGVIPVGLAMFLIQHGGMRHD